MKIHGIEPTKIEQRLLESIEDLKRQIRILERKNERLQKNLDFEKEQKEYWYNECLRDAIRNSR